MKTKVKQLDLLMKPKNRKSTRKVVSVTAKNRGIEKKKIVILSTGTGKLKTAKKGKYVSITPPSIRVRIA